MRDKKYSGIEGRVANGARLLDRKKPGWHRQIDTDRLNIAHGSKCALGQTYGSYNEGVEVLNLDGKTTRDHGFQASVSLAWWERDDEYMALTAAWKVLIETRLDEERAKWAEEQPVRWSLRRVLTRR